MVSAYVLSSIVCTLGLLVTANGQQLVVSRIDAEHSPEPTGAVTSFKLDPCAAKVLWREGDRGTGGPIENTLSFDEPGLYSSKVSSGTSEFVKPDQAQVDEYAKLKSRIVFLYHLAKFDWWGLQGRFIFPDNNPACDKDFSVGFSHPAVPASYNNPEKLIPVAVKDIDGYSPFFSFNDGHPSTSSSWVAALLSAMKAEEEKNPLPQPHDATQALKRSLEIFSGAKAVASEIEFQVKGDSLALHPAAQNILANAAHTPVFLTHLRKVHVISHKNQDYYETVTMAVSDTSDLDDYTKAAFKNSPPPRKDGYIPKDADDKTNYEKIEFKSNGLPSSNEPFTTEPIATADQLKAMKYTLVYLEGADTADFASQKNADWAMFSDDRFN